MDISNQIVTGTKSGFKLTSLEREKIPYNEDSVILVPLAVMKKIFPTYAKVFQLGGEDWFYAIKCSEGAAVCTQMMDPQGDFHPFVMAIVN